MSRITIIAGPPGVGKSTMGHLYVPSDMEIIKKDELIQANKAFYYKIFQQLAIQKWLSTINDNLHANRDFAFELNLGMPMHWDFAQSLRQQQAYHTLNIVLFFTDHLDMCKQRAEERFKAGQHEVNPAVLENMYHNTLPLLKHHFAWIEALTLIDARRDNSFSTVASYLAIDQSLETGETSPSWFNDNLKPFLQEQISRHQQQTSYSR